MTYVLLVMVCSIAPPGLDGCHMVLDPRDVVYADAASCGRALTDQYRAGWVPGLTAYLYCDGVKT